jgi:hypothetical protein
MLLLRTNKSNIHLVFNLLYFLLFYSYTLLFSSYFILGFPYSFYTPTTGSAGVFTVKPVTFDLLFLISIIIYLSLIHIYYTVHLPPKYSPILLILHSHRALKRSLFVSKMLSQEAGNDPFYLSNLTPNIPNKRKQISLNYSFLFG